FVGNNGPYQNADGTLNPNAVGFTLTGTDFVVVRMTEVNVPAGQTARAWDAVYASASHAALVGVDGFSLSAANIQVQVNTGNAAALGRVVDFTTSDLDSTTGNGSTTIDVPGSDPLDGTFKTNLVQVSA